MDALRDQPWLAAVEAEGFAGLAEPVRLELDEKRTVLVGKNGSGKSLVMEALAFAAKAARFRQPVSQAVRFRCEIARPSTSSLAYEYRLQLVDRVERGLVETVEEWEERCWELEGEDLWNIRNSQLVLRGGDPRPFLPAASLLYVGDKYYQEVALEAGLIHHMLAGIHLVQ
jgi:energy-coupling factor transporter ATP-binding protein EcfA2